MDQFLEKSGIMTKKYYTRKIRDLSFKKEEEKNTRVANVYVLSYVAAGYTKSIMPFSYI